MLPLPSEGQTVSGWQLLRRLGQGATGAVFLARRAAREGGGFETAALKLVPLPPGDPDAAASFLRQAQAAARLVHPDIVALRASGLEGDLGWLAMEPVPGGDLGRYTLPARLLPEALVLQVGERIARALAHAHAHGFVHRDLKPANVIVHWPAGTVKLADLGLVRAAGAEVTKTGIVAGTPAYMAPELLAGAVPDARSDLYALGVLLFQLLTGRLPHDAPTMGELLRRVAHEPVPALAELRPDLPPALGALLARLLQREPQQREGRAEAVAEALAAIARALPATPSPPPPTQAP